MESRAPSGPGGQGEEEDMWKSLNSLARPLATKDKGRQGGGRGPLPLEQQKYSSPQSGSGTLSEIPEGVRGSVT